MYKTINELIPGDKFFWAGKTWEATAAKRYDARYCVSKLGWVAWLTWETTVQVED